jgi:hypothetical protein
MNTVLKQALLALGTLAAVAPAGATGTAQVSYVQPEKFADAGWGSVDRERTLKSLSEHFHVLGKRLPDGQTLRVEVLDVDLAGEVWPRGMNEVRILRGGADWPRMTLRYTVLDGMRTLKSGETRIADMNYLLNPQRLQHHTDLPYEKRMLDVWFKEEVAVTP